jgi:hypothetical protein
MVSGSLRLDPEALGSSAHVTMQGEHLASAHMSSDDHLVAPDLSTGRRIMAPVDPYIVRVADTTVEMWSGYRIQFGGFEKHAWQKALKTELKQAFTSMTVPVGVPFAAYYDTTNTAVSDTENSLFTNLRESMPKGISWLRFEHGTGTPPQPPVQIDLVGGHLHYYRYEFGRRWTTWEPDQTLARWNRIPRRLAGDGSARPAWYAFRDANAKGLMSLSADALDARANFGIRLTVHATKMGQRNAISCSEELIDGAIAAFHSDQHSDELVAALTPRFPGICAEELRRALDHPVGPLIATPAIRVTPGLIQIGPADERCRLGELAIRQDSTSICPELSGELFTVRRIAHPS